VHHASTASDDLLTAVAVSPARSRRASARWRNLAQFTEGFGAGTPGRSRGSQTRSALSIALSSDPGGPGASPNSG